jgi:hypothetical protein
LPRLSDLCLRHKSQLSNGPAGSTPLVSCRLTDRHDSLNEAVKREWARSAAGGWLLHLCEVRSLTAQSHNPTTGSQFRGLWADPQILSSCGSLLQAPTSSCRGATKKHGARRASRQPPPQNPASLVNTAIHKHRHHQTDHGKHKSVRTRLLGRPPATRKEESDQRAASASLF